MVVQHVIRPEKIFHMPNSLFLGSTKQTPDIVNKASIGPSQAQIAVLQKLEHDVAISQIHALFGASAETFIIVLPQAPSLHQDLHDVA